MQETESPRISVIVPCYNIAEYVERCLSSLAAQTHSNFEVILVDDGSTDETAQILDAQAKQDPRFRVVHQQHQGTAVARNRGLAESCAPFIAFVDGDDYVSARFLEVLEGLIKLQDSDMASCGLMKVKPNAAIRIADDENAIASALQESQILDSATFMELCAQSKMHISPCAKLFRKELLQRHPFPAGKFYEDLWVVGSLVADAKRVAVSKMALYCYVARPNSTTRAQSSNQTILGLQGVDAKIQKAICKPTGP